MRFLWAFAIPVGLFNALAVRWRARALVEANPELRHDATRIFRAVLVAHIVPFTLLGLIQELGALRSIFFVFSLDFADPYVSAGWAALLAFWGLSLWWVWRTDGPDAWARISPPSQRLTPSTLRFGITAAVVGAITALVMGSASGFATVLHKP